MKKIVLLLMAVIFAGVALLAQSVAEGIHYQAIARDASGQPLVNMPVTLQVSLGAQAKVWSAYFVESHEVLTDERGLFTLIIGEGKPVKGAIGQVPWSREQIWLDVTLQNPASPPFNLVSRSRLLSVPYALHAASTNKLTASEAPAEEKNQSIYWTTSGNSLTVPETHFLGTRDDQDLIFKTNSTTRMKVSKEGQVQIFSGVDGSDTNINAYPLIVTDDDQAAVQSNQGIYIRVNGSRSYDTDFVTFGDSEKLLGWGTIEGQTFPELEEYWAYQVQVALYALNAAANVGLLVTQALATAGAFVSVCCAGSGPGQALDVIAIGVDLANIISNSITWGVKTRDDIGVSYTSGAADYAEYLERMPGERNLQPGEVVGVKGGQVSLNTDQADHYMVVSQNPIVLGNMPAPGKEDRYEKIAFMGQVAVRIRGDAAVGDYILPSGNNDGFGIAVHPTKMKIGDYSRIIGVAWQAGAPNVPFNVIRVAVGINTNDLAREVVALETKVKAVMAYLKGESQTVIAPGQHQTVASFFSTIPPSPMKKTLTDEEFDTLLDSNSALFQEIFSHAKARLALMGHDMKEHPAMLAFLDNPVPYMKQLRRDPAFLSNWAQFDQATFEVKRN